jgi:Tfp pilus assembly protein PilF
MNWTREQAEVYLAEGSLCRAAVVAQEVVKVDPSVANLELLAEIYMQQGLHEDAFDLHVRMVKKSGRMVAQSGPLVQ